MVLECGVQPHQVATHSRLHRDILQVILELMNSAQLYVFIRMATHTGISALLSNQVQSAILYIDTPKFQIFCRPATCSISTNSLFLGSYKELISHTPARTQDSLKPSRPSFFSLAGSEKRLHGTSGFEPRVAQSDDGSKDAVLVAMPRMISWSAGTCKCIINQHPCRSS